MPAELMGAAKIFCKPYELKGQHSFLRFYAGIWVFVDVSETYLYRDPVDFRKAINGLVVLVEQQMQFVYKLEGRLTNTLLLR